MSAAKKLAAPCSCIADVNSLLSKKEERLITAFDLRGGSYLVIGVKKKHGRGKATLLLPTYCPFCGQKQERA